MTLHNWLFRNSHSFKVQFVPSAGTIAALCYFFRISGPSDLWHLNFPNYSEIYSMWILIFGQDKLTTHKNCLEKEFLLSITKKLYGKVNGTVCTTPMGDWDGLQSHMPSYCSRPKKCYQRKWVYMIVYMTVVPAEEIFKWRTLVSIWTITKLLCQTKVPKICCLLTSSIMKNVDIFSSWKPRAVSLAKWCQELGI